MKAIRTFGILAIAVATVLGLSGAASAADYAWTNAAGGTYSTPGNWNPLGPPTSADSATFGTAAVYTVTFNSAATTTGLTVNAGTVTFNLNGYTYSAGTSNGIVVSNATLVVSSAGGGGILVPNNPIWNGNLLSVVAGATLRIQNGALVTLSNSMPNLIYLDTSI